MEVSRLTFTKETKEKMNTPLNHFQRGELRWKRIEELQNSGRLSQVRNRMDLVEMLGAERGYNAFYAWVSNMIKRGHLRETVTGLGKDGRMEYEYSVISSPNFDHVERARIRKETIAKRKAEEDKSTIEAPIVPHVMLNRVSVKDASADDGKIKATIKYKDLSIVLENIDRETINGIIGQLAIVADNQ